MTRKIAVADLRVGMYVQDLNCGWMDHPFLRKELALTREDQIERIRSAGIREVYIDPARGIDGPGLDALEADREIEQEMVAFAEAEMPKPRQTSFREESEAARRIQGEANRLIRDLMQDVRLGRQIDSERVEPVVENITQSILRNGGALLSLCRIKNKDDYTFQHSVAVCGLQTAFCRALKMGHEDIHEAGIGGLLHDIGKTRALRSLASLVMRGEVDRPDAREVAEILAPYPFVGFSTYGEQYNGLHVNQTLTGIALGAAKP